MRRTFLTTAALAAALLAAAPVLADPPSAPAAPAPAAPKGEFGGPLVSGVCLISREQVFAESKVGLAAKERLKELDQRAKANFDAERRKLEAEAKALQAQQGTLTPAQGQHRQQQLQARAQALQTEGAQIARELEATRIKASGQIEETLQPILLAAYQAKGCGLLLSREAVVGGNLGNDLTAAVIQGLDAKMTTITFEREHLPPSTDSLR
jgi:Skp family chaperone for outer membrane proteins